MDQNPYRNVATERTTVASEAEVEERRAFIQRTYLHLVAAIFGFVGIEFFLFETGVAQAVAPKMVGGMNWLLVLGAFIGVGYLANRLAMSKSSTGLQYAGLSLFVVAESFIFIPLLYMAAMYSHPTVIPAAGVITLSTFSVLTGYVFVTKQDFSFLGPALAIATAIAFGAIIVAILFGFNLGTLFAAAMIALASGYILYYTSNVLHEYNTEQHVAASLALFSAVAMLFYYILYFMVAGE